MVCLTAWQQLRLLLAYGCPPHVGDCDCPSDLINPSNPFDRERRKASRQYQYCYRTTAILQN